MRDLRHSSDDEPGFSRIRRGKGWSYHDEDGGRIDDGEVIERLNTLAVPPAYSDVWYCRDANGHIQATGIDERGRKQYRYHDAYRELAEEAKFDRCVEFGKALPKIRKQVARHLRRRKLRREPVLAAIVRLLDTAHLRIGNRTYAKSNKSFGATTLQHRHVKKLKTRIKLNFRAKHGVERDVTVTDASLTRIVGELNDLPGQALFQYENDRGEFRQISSSDVNAYLKEISGTDFTAKHFRTWGASRLAFEEMERQLKTGERITLKSIVEPVAAALGNTPAVTRSSYIHPAIIDAVKDKPLDPLGGAKLPVRGRKRLERSEARLIAFLEPGALKPSKRKRLARFLKGRAPA